VATKSVQTLLERGLSQLEEELSAYSSESNLWLTDGSISNSAGNLALHLCGNLQHFIGATLGHSDYVRDRDAEFADRDVPREDMLRQVHETLTSIRAALSQLTPEDLAQTYPVSVRPQPVTTEFWLIHLTAHLNYHLGQINYHRRLFDAPK